MSTEFSNLPLPNLLGKSCKKPYLFKKTQNELVPITIKPKHPVKIPSQSYFFMNKRYILKDSDIIIARLRPSNGTIEPSFPELLNGLEVIKLYQRNKPISITLLDPLNNPDIGNRTGFGIRTNSGDLLIVAARNVVRNQFGTAKVIAACFGIDQYSFSVCLIEKYKNLRYQFRPSIQELEVVDLVF